MSQILAYWLMPAQPFRRACEKQIDRLARELDAPSFEPHVTIHSSRATGGTSPGAILAKAAAKAGPISLQVIGINHSEKFTKTLFIEFAHSLPLMALAAQLRELSQNASDYKLRPHLSLAYKHLAKRRRAALARAIGLRFKIVRFDELAAVLCPERTESAHDVRAWRVVHRQPV